MRVILPLLSVAVAAAAPANAAVHIFSAPLLGSNEVPANASPATGTTSVIVDDVALTIRFVGEFAGLTAPTTMAHIHIAPPGSNGPVATTVPSLPGFPLGVTAGAFDVTRSLADVGTYNPAFLGNNGGDVLRAATSLLAAHQAGNAYFNIHTSAFPGGEIRANLVAVPEPATWGMMIGGFALVGATLRRRSPRPHRA